jgi:hypothetical protein
MNLERLQQIKAQHDADAVSKNRHAELLLDNTRTQEVIVKSIAALVNFLEKGTLQTNVVNQLTEIGTPDALKVVAAIGSLQQTVKEQKPTDLSEITEVMRSILSEAKEIPKSHNVIDIPKPIDHAKHFQSLEKAVKSLEAAVKAQELSVDAPVVNVPETNVNVEAPDLTPIKDSVVKSSKDVVSAVKAIKLPELNTEPLEKLLKKTNKLLSELPELMPSSGGGGSGRATPYEDSNNIPQFVQLTADGKIPVEATITDPNQEDAIPYAEVLTATTAISPASGKRIHLLKSQVLQSPDNETANLVTLSFASTGDLITGWAFSDSNEWIGAVDEDLDITLGSSQPVSVNIRYKELS